MKVTRDALRTIALFAVIALSWGGTYVALKVGLPYTRPFGFAALRLAGGAVVLILFAWLRTRRVPRDLRTHALSCALGLLNSALFVGLLTLGISARGVSAGLASILTYTQPLMVAGLAVLTLGERLGRRRMAGLALGFAGMAVTVSGDVRGGGAPLWSYLCLLGAALAWALGTVLFKRVEAHIDVLWSSALQVLYSAFPLALAAWIREGGIVFHAAPIALLALAHLTLFSSGLAMLAYFYLLSRGAATTVTSYIFIVPLTAVILGMLLLHERATPLLVVGGAGVLAGIYLVNSRRPSAPRARSSAADIAAR